MKKRILLAILASTLLLSSMLSMLPLTTVYASTTHHVYPWQSIQEAINSAQPGDTIFVHNGVYYENVVVNKTVLLIGENREKTAIWGNGNGTVLYVFAHNVNISRFTVRNSSHSAFDGGIYLNNSQGCSIDGNKIDVEGSGIIVSGGSGNCLMNNRIGPSYSWYGIYLVNSSGNVIVGNVQSTSDVGIKLKGSCGNNISGNLIAHSIAGHISLDSGSDNNSITNHELYAVFPTLYNIDLHYSDGNAIYHNNLYSYFMKQVFVDHANNVWDNGYPNGGNYWNDYNGTDFYSGPYQNETGGDGIGDTPYVIDGNNQDNYPLMNPYGSVRNLDTNLTYLAIQSAIYAPETLDGHTIFVSSGTYYENVVVNKSVYLIGENAVTTTIDGSGTGRVVSVRASGVEIRGFTIQNGGQLMADCGVFIGNCSGNTISDNIIRKNYNGLELLQSNSSNIVGNTIINNSYAGVYIHELGNNTICGNAIAYNVLGGWIASSTIPNTFYHNNFIDNTNQVNDPGASKWDNGCEGNYWSNYNGTDLDGDGIGDEYLPWEGVDYYPLMSPYIEGDVNHDAIVDLFDCVIVGLAYGSRPNDPNWNPHADLNEDKIIDLFDIVIVGIHYGETW